jgi:LmbE family N-acetylglucosaminyl deacetylase
MPAPTLTSASRLTLVAPHPDDEALACSVILQRAVRARAAIRVIYATDGDDNPWPQRVLERKWRLDEKDRKRWGRLRRAEALAALHVLGVGRTDTRFIALPDQRLTHLLLSCTPFCLEQLAECITDSPTDLLVPSIHDTHPDHNALAVILRLLLAKSYPLESPMRVWSYTVHGRSAAFFEQAQKVESSKLEAAVKEKAIRCHQTQLKLSRRRFLAYAGRPECFLEIKRITPVIVDGPIRWIWRQLDTLRLKLRVSAKPIDIASSTLFILGHDIAGRVRCMRTVVPVHSCTVELFDCLTRQLVGISQYRGDAFTGEFAISLDLFSSSTALFVKLERRSWFFDESGWLEIPPIIAQTPVARTSATQSTTAEALS